MPPDGERDQRIAAINAELRRRLLQVPRRPKDFNAFVVSPDQLEFYGLPPEPDKLLHTCMRLRPTWAIDPAERSKRKEDAKTRIYELQGKKKA